MGYVLDRGRPDNKDNLDAAGVTIIETRGTSHKIEFLVDHVTNEPRIVHTPTRSPIAVGTRITIRWPQQPLYLINEPLPDAAENRFKETHQNYTWLNSPSVAARHLERSGICQRPGIEPRLDQMGTSRSDQPALVQ